MTNPRQNSPDPSDRTHIPGVSESSHATPLESPRTESREVWPPPRVDNPVRARLAQATAGIINLDGKLASIGPVPKISYDEIAANMADLEQQATQDPLTKLSNRAGLQSVFDNCMQRATAHPDEVKGKSMGVLAIDVNNMKTYNNEGNHQLGDIVLKAMAEAFVAISRQGQGSGYIHTDGKDNPESSGVGRRGGDEFVILIPRVDSETNPVEIANRIKNEFCKLIAIKVDQIKKAYPRWAELLTANPLTVTAGFHLEPYPITNTLEELIEKADGIQVKSKNAGRESGATRATSVSASEPM